MSSNSRRPRNLHSSSRTIKTAQTAHFSLKTVDRSPGERQMTIIISAATVKKASQRNFIRRQIRNILKEFVKSPLGLTVVVRPKIAELTRKGLREELFSIAKKIS